MSPLPKNPPPRGPNRPPLGSGNRPPLPGKTAGFWILLIVLLFIAFQMMVVDRMDGDFVILVQGSNFGGTDPPGPVQHARIEVERPPDTVPVDYLDQPPVMDRAVVVACGQCASLSLRKETEPNTHHVSPSIRQWRPPIAP